MLMLFVNSNFHHCLTDVHLSKLIMLVLTFGDTFKFFCVITANVFENQQRFFSQFFIHLHKKQENTV